MSAKLPVSAATRWGFETVTCLPRLSIKVTLSRWSGISGAAETGGDVQAVRRNSAMSAGTSLKKPPSIIGISLLFPSH